MMFSHRGGQWSSLLPGIVLQMLLVGVSFNDVETSNEKRVIHKKVGESVELSPNLSTEGVTRADWKYGNSVVARKGLGVLQNHQFQDRLEFNNITFTLTVKKLTLQDSGEFRFISEVNNKQRSTVSIDLQVHEPLTQQPVLTSNISQPDSDGNCKVSLECKSAESSVSFSWTVENQIYTGPSLQHNIRLQDGATTFTCTVSNGVSEKSESITETCGNKGSFFISSVRLFIGVLVLLLLLGLLLHYSKGFCWNRLKKSEPVNQDQSQQQVYSSLSHGDACVYEVMRGSKEAEQGEALDENISNQNDETRV